MIVRVLYFRKRFKNEVKWSGGRSTPAGNRGKAETSQREGTEKV